MKFKTLPDGGVLIYGPEMAEVGDRGIPTHVLYRHPGDKRRPALEVAIEVRDGIPIITAVRVDAEPDRGVHIRAKDIRIGMVALDSSLTYWLSELTYRRGAERPDGRRPWWRYDQVPPDERKAAIRTIRRARGQLRRRMTDEMLARIAETYATATPPRHEAIAVVFDVSPRTAQRYIAHARQAGLING
jgi:hypothetical protein